jgi:hypothetical protein
VGAASMLRRARASSVCLFSAWGRGLQWGYILFTVVIYIVYWHSSAVVAPFETPVISWWCSRRGRAVLEGRGQGWPAQRHARASWIAP